MLICFSMYCFVFRSDKLKVWQTVTEKDIEYDQTSTGLAWLT